LSPETRRGAAQGPPRFFNGARPSEDDLVLGDARELDADVVVDAVAREVDLADRGGELEVEAVDGLACVARARVARARAARAAPEPRARRPRGPRARRRR
jgi:hypothetical protein